MTTQIVAGLQKYISYEVLSIMLCGTVVIYIVSCLIFLRLTKMAKADFDNSMRLQTESWNRINGIFSSAAEVIKISLQDACWYFLNVLTTALLVLAKEKLKDQYEVGCLTTIWQQMVDEGGLPSKNNLAIFLERFMSATEKSPNLQLYECVKSVYNCLRDVHDILGYPIDSQNMEKLIRLKEVSVRKADTLREVAEKVMKSIADEKKATEKKKNEMAPDELAAIDN